jgi:GT2 family glycosyltransferase
VLTTLASLRRQTVPYDEFEVIVVDNGSTDGTLNVVQAYVSASLHPERKPEDTWRVRCLSEPRNGLAYARHTGLLAASGEIAVFLDDDVIADPFLLENLQEAYDATGADAVGGRVELRWEARRASGASPRPYWLMPGLLDVLGHYEPAAARVRLPDEISFSNSNFSVNVAALREVGAFSPFVSRRQRFPANMESEDLCRRLREAGYALWYEPDAIVAHRVTAPLLRRAYFVGRAYWQGRSETLAQYSSERLQASEQRYTVRGLWQQIRPELHEMLALWLLHRPLMRLAGRPAGERLEAAMAQARSWGRLQQHLAFFEHAPLEPDMPAVLLVRPANISDKLGSHVTAELLTRALWRLDVPCIETTGMIPLSWLWRHRAAQGQATGIIHFYQPGALMLTYRQRRQLWFRLWLARCLGMRIACTDSGGWWQCTRGPRFLARRVLERKLLYASDVILAFSRQPEQLYPDRILRPRVRCLPHPGLRGLYDTSLMPTKSELKDRGWTDATMVYGNWTGDHKGPHPISSSTAATTIFERGELAAARQLLGLPDDECFVYLCLAGAHTERELAMLIEAFDAGGGRMSMFEEKPLLMVAGTPGDKQRMSGRILRLAAQNPNVYLFTATPGTDDMALYLGAANALALPHFAVTKAGSLELAMLALSYGLAVIAPDLPRFRGMLPPHASVLYDPARRESLIQACLKAQKLDFILSEQEKQALDAETGWGQYAHRLLKIYRRVLETP